MARKYAVEVRWTVSKCYVVSAESKQDAEEIVNEHLNAGELSYFDDGYQSEEAEAECLGTADKVMGGDYDVDFE